jgi:CHAT domain-containing protein/TPR repeat protein
MMILKKWFIVFVLCLISIVVSAENQEEVESPSSQATSFQAIVEKAERGDADAQYNLGVMYYLGKEVAQNDIEAAKWFRKAAKQGHAGAYGSLGWLLITQGKFDEAQSLTEKAQKKQPHVFAWLINLGHIYLLKGDRQTARSYYQEALPLIPNEASFEQGPVADFELFIENGWQVKACRSELKWIWSAFKQLKLAKTYNQQVIQYHQQGRFKEALPLAEKAWNLRKKILGEKHPSTLTSLNHLARIHGDLGHLNEALSLLEKAYRPSSEELGEKHYSTVLSLNNLARINRDLGHLNEALPLSEKAYRLSSEVLGEKHPDTLGILTNLALIHRDLGHLNEALPLSEKAYRLSSEVLGEKHPDTIISLNNLAVIHKDLGHLTEALPLFEKGYHLSLEVLGKKHPDTVISLNNLAVIHKDLGHLTEALPLSEKGYHLSLEVLGEKHYNTVLSLNNLAMIHRDLGHLNEALLLSEKGYHLSLEVLGEKHYNTVLSLNNLALIHRELGHLIEALPLSEKGYHLSLEVLGEKHYNTVLSLNNLALIHRDLGHLNLPLSEKAYRLYKEVLGEKHPNTVLSLNNLAMIHRDLGHLNEALPLCEKAYRLSSEVLGENHPSTLISLNNLAMSHKKLGHLTEALPLLEKGYRLRKEELGENHPSTLISLNNLARIHIDLGHLTEALPLSEKAYHLSKEVLGEKHPARLIIRITLAYTYLKQGKIDKAIEHYEKFVAGVETLRSGDLSAENRQALFKRWVPGYFLLSRLYAAQSRPQDAFHLAEMSKARTLLESLAAKLAAQQSGLSTAEQQQLQDYNARLAFLNNRIAKALEDNRLNERIRLEAEKNQLVIQLTQFERELRAKYPKYDQLSEVEIIGAFEGAKYLPVNAVLISYLVNENAVLAFTLQYDGTLTTHRLGKIPNLKKDLETYRRLLSLGIQVQEQSPNKPIWLKKPPTIESLSRQLGKQLLEPLKNIIKDKPHWIISPSGALALIPFETLRLEGENQPVIAQHQISYVQSLSVLKLLQERDKVYNGLNVKNLENRGTLLAMGAPLYESTATNKGNPSTTDYKIADHLVMRGGDYARAFRQLGRGGDYWKNLPGAERELKQLEELFKETKPRIYKQADATEAKLQELNQQGILAQYRYLVFSAHGYLSPQVPALSSIVLGQVNNPPEIDGYVTAGEWPGYDLKSDLMVLSACETGVGSVVGGEGVMGLPYAFYVAGNKNTILTLWEISDNITTEFTTSFFAKLKAGVGQIEALTETKREFLKKGGIYSNPKYWAAFVLYGV